MRRRDFVLAGIVAPDAALRAAPSLPAGPAIEWPPIGLLDGGTLSPASWQDRPAIVVFWATHCPFCRRHNAHLDRLHRAPQAQGLRVLGVALDTDADTVRRYMSSNGYGFPVTLDGGRLRQRLTPRRVIPMTCALDRRGRLLQAIAGEMFEEDLLGLAGALHRAGA